MKKLFRKPLALLLAMALIVGSLTVAVYALTEEESGIFNLYTKFYRIDGDDEKAVDYGTGNDTGDGTLYVKKGDRIKAVMSAESLMADGSDPDSEFNIYGISLLLSYNKNLVVLDTDYYDPSKGKTVFNSKIGSISVITGEYQAADLGISDSNKQFINAYSAAITDIGDQHSDTGFVLTRDGLGKDIITWYFTVLQDATLTDESLFDVEEASVCSMDDSAVYTTFITSFDEIGDISSDYYYLELNSSSETIAIGGTVNYDVNNTTIPASGTIATGNTISDKGDGVYEEIGEKLVKKGTGFEMFYRTAFADGKDIMLLPTDEYLSDGETRCTVLESKHRRIAFVSSCDMKRFETKTDGWVYPTKKSVLLLHPLMGSKVFIMAHLKKKTENQGIDYEEALEVLSKSAPEIDSWIEWVLEIIDREIAAA